MTDLLPGMDEMLGAMPRPDLLPDALPHAAGDGSAERDVPRDAAGTAFDPRVHATKPDGKPSVTKRGYFRRRHGAGSAGRMESHPRLNLDGVSGGAPAASGGRTTGPEAAGATCAGLYVMVGGILLGEDFAPEDAHEFGTLSDAFADYCRAKGIDDFPPGIALCLACGMYAAKRLPKPTVQRRISGAIGWVRERAKNAWAYLRPNRMRKNDTGKASGAGFFEPRETGSDT